MKFWRPQFNLQPRFTLAFTAFAALLVVAFGTVVYFRAQQVLQQTATSELLGDVLEKEAAVSAWAEDGHSGLTVLAASLDNNGNLELLTGSTTSSVAAPVAHNRLQSELQAWVSSGQFTQILVIDAATGRVIGANDSTEEGKYKEDTLFFQNGHSGPYLQPPVYSFQQQAPVIMISRPLVSHDQRVLGVLAAQLNLMELAQIISRHTDTHPTKDAYLVNRSNLLVTQPRLISDPVVLQRGINTPAVQQCLQQQSGTAAESDYRGVPVLVAYRWLADKQLCLVVQIDESDALSPVRMMGTTLIVGSLIALLIATVVGVGLGQAVALPIRALQQGTTRLAQGELDIRLPEQSADELGRLARDFNRMAAALAVQQANQRAYASDLEQRVNERTAALAQLNTELEERVKERTEQLRQSEQKFHLAFRNNPSGIIITRQRDGQIVDVNNAYLQLTGFRGDELVGHNVIELGIVTPEDRQRVIQMQRERGYVRDLEMTLGKKDGTLLEVVAYAERIILDGEPCLVSLVMDIGERKRAEQAILRRNTELAALNQMGQALSRLIEQGELLKRICSIVGQLLDISNLYIALYDEATQTISFPIYMEAGKNEPRVARTAMNGLTEYVIRTRQPLKFLHNAEAQAVALGIDAHGPPGYTYVGVPMIAGDHVIGVIAVRNFENDKPFDEGHYDILASLAAQAAIALENARLFDESRRLSRTDPLTGVANRRYLAEGGEREVRRALRFHHPLSLLLLDIDHFKAVNDRYGHAFGDQVLRAAAQCLNHEIRESDILARYGGEEFVIVSVETDLVSAEHLAERLRTRVEKLTTKTEAAEIQVTISIGYTTLRLGEGNLDSLIDRADRGLYAAKRAGRNTVRAGE